jgi:hypothetical protein
MRAKLSGVEVNAASVRLGDSLARVSIGHGCLLRCPSPPAVPYGSQNCHTDGGQGQGLGSAGGARRFQGRELMLVPPQTT